MFDKKSQWQFKGIELMWSPDGYRSRSPVSRGGRGGYGSSSRQYASPSPPPPAREVVRSSRSRTRDYTPERSYSHKEYSR